MENYIKAENEEEFRPEVAIEGTKEGVLVMHVKAGSKIKNLMQFAEKRFSSDSTGQIVWEGSGDAVPKTITCAEIMKKKSSYSLHQITRLASMRIVETWKPRLEGLDDIRVNRQLPLVKILLSKDPLDADANGYQAPEDAHGLFDRGQGANRPKKNNKPRQQQQQLQQQRRRSRPPNAPVIDEKDETLLADTIRNEGVKKQHKQERKKKRAEMQGDAKKQAANVVDAEKQGDAKKQAASVVDAEKQGDARKQAANVVDAEKKGDARKQAANIVNSDPSSKTDDSKRSPAVSNESQIAAKTGDEAAKMFKIKVKTETSLIGNESERTESGTKTDGSLPILGSAGDTKPEAMDVGD